MNKTKMFLFLVRLRLLFKHRSHTSSRTRIIEGRKNALMEAFAQSFSVNHSHYCVTGDELVKSYKPFLPLLRDQIARGGSSKILANIERETIPAVVELTANGAEIRHIDSSNLRRSVIYDNTVAYFSIVEPEIWNNAANTVFETEGDDLWVSSTEPSIVQSAKKRFDLDWDSAVSSQQRITELVEGRVIRVIKDNKEAASTYRTLATQATKEALVLLPTARSMIIESRPPTGIIDILAKSAQEKNVQLKILCPINADNSKVVEQIKATSPSNIEIRENNETTFTILIVDGEQVFTSELREVSPSGSNGDNNNSSSSGGSSDIIQTMRLSTYSNNRPTIESFSVLFQSLWHSKEISQQLAESNRHLQAANEQLKAQDAMKTEFMNMASHEMRTPTQIILGYASLLDNNNGGGGRSSNDNSNEMISGIHRNALRLQQLISNMLDVAIIENKSMALSKEDASLSEIIASAIQDVKSQLAGSSQTEIVFEEPNEQVFAKIDKDRMTQVIHNLINNSLKFTKDGTVKVQLEKTTDEQIMIKVTDSGSGIDPAILPKLFTKFTTKSDKGTGLGLYVSKNIIEAHGGRIWAENNKEGKGATFSIVIPV